MTFPEPADHTWRRRSTVLAIAGVAVAAAASAASGPATAAAPATAPVLLANDPPVAVEVAAGGGHVVATRPTDDGAELLELEAGGEPRVIRQFPGLLGRPTVGTDARGRAVVVVSPCAKPTTREVERMVGGCSLQVVDVETGRSAALAGSAGAYLGDLDRGRSVVARRSTSVGVRVALAPIEKGGRSIALPVSQVYPRARSGEGYPLSTLFVDALDLQAGSVAATVFVGMANGGDGGGSFLLRSDAGRRWTVLARSTYGGASGLRRVFRAPELTRTGVRAYYDGADNDDSYVGRWTRPGDPVTERSVRPSTVQDAALDGDRLVTSPIPDSACAGEDGTGGCPVQSWGPYALK